MMRRYALLLAIICLAIIGNCQIPDGYYDSAIGLSGNALKSELNNIIDGHTEFSYDAVKEALKVTDVDSLNANNVICFYTGWSYAKIEFGNGSEQWNREHIWSKSHGDFGDVPPAGTDLHHLRPADASVNSTKSNRDFDEATILVVDGSGTTQCYKDTYVWEPRDEVKGDVARMIFYMATRYEGENSEIDLEIVDYINTAPTNVEPFYGRLSTLLSWHNNDPVNKAERDRNDIIYTSYQSNRNPYIDHPEYVNAIWAGTNPEPTNHVSSFAADGETSYSINLSWNDNDGANAAGRYLIMINTTANFTDPVDGTEQSDDTDITDNDGKINVAHGIESYTFTGLTINTLYYFKIYPYSNFSVNVDYKTDGIVPEVNSSTSATPTIPNVFFSEYIEGSSNNKAIEIYNGELTSIDLSDYTIILYSNGSATPSTTLTLPALTLESGEVYVVYHSSASDEIKSKGDITSGVTNYNGDDAVELVFNELSIDIIGVIGTDPGAAWDVAGVPGATGEHTLVRKLSVTSGNTNWTSSAGTTTSDSEWIVFAQDHFYNLGVFGTGWTGTTDNDWTTSTNWDVQIPNAGINVLVNQSATNYPTISAAANCNNLLIESDASLVGVDNLTVNGISTVERSITAYSGDSDGYHFLSSPVSALTIAGSDFVPTEFEDDLSEWDEATNTWLNYYGTFYDTEFEVGKGYLVAYNTKLGGKFNGSLNKTSLTKNLSYTSGQGNGWNLLGNPYPSAIDWDLITKTGNINGSVYVLSGTDNTYVSWNGSAGGLTDGHIPTNNGFFVKANTTATSITMDVADQVQSTSIFLKNSEKTIVENTLRLSISNEVFTNNAYIQYRTDASSEFDNSIDAYKLFSSSEAPQLFTSINNINYAINCIPFSTDEVQLPLGIVNSKSSVYTISATGIESFTDQNFEVYLEDTENGSMINLATDTYTFSAENTDYLDRFVLHFYGVTSTVENKMDYQLSIFANDNTVNIKFNQLPTSNIKVVVLNIMGQQVYSSSMQPALMSSFILNEIAGVYIIKVSSNNGVLSKKIVIE